MSGEAFDQSKLIEVNHTYPWCWEICDIVAESLQNNSDSERFKEIVNLISSIIVKLGGKHGILGELAWDLAGDSIYGKNSEELILKRLDTIRTLITLLEDKIKQIDYPENFSIDDINQAMKKDLEV